MDSDCLGADELPGAHLQLAADMQELSIFWCKNAPEKLLDLLRFSPKGFKVLEWTERGAKGWHVWMAWMAQGEKPPCDESTAVAKKDDGREES